MDLENITIEAAKAAGEYIRTTAFEPEYVEFKSKNDPVTNLDREAEQLIMQYFNTQGEFNFIGEEFGIQDNGAKYTVYTDPIDGTKSFVFGDFNTSTSITVMEEALPRATAVYDFMKDIMYVANDTESYILHPSVGKQLLPKQFDGFTVVRTLSNSPKEAPKWMKEEPRHMYQQNGSFALSLAQVATGSYEAFFAPPFKKDGRNDIGDILAGAHLMRNAGYRVTDANGQELDYLTMDKGLLAVKK